MRVLFVSQGGDEATQIGYDLAWRNAVSEGRKVEVRNIPWMGVVERDGWRALWDEIVRVNDKFAPDLIFFQRFHSGEPESPRTCIAKLRQTKNHPLIFADLGDPFQPYFCRFWVRRFPQAIVELAQDADIFFMSSLGSAAEWLRKKGARRVELLPLAFSNYHFPDWAEPVSEHPDFDVVMLGGICIQRRRPISTLTHIHYRYDTAKRLLQRYGKRFGLFGGGWRDFPACQGSVGFRDQVKLFKRARICVDARPPIVDDYYCSNRPFYIAGSGSTLVQYYMPRLEELLEEGVHSHFVRHPQDLIKVCDGLLGRNPAELRAIGRETQKFIQEHHTTDKRVDTIISYAEHLKDSSVPLRLWHFR